MNYTIITIADNVQIRVTKPNGLYFIGFSRLTDRLSIDDFHENLSFISAYNSEKINWNNSTNITFNGVVQPDFVTFRNILISFWTS